MAGIDKIGIVIMCVLSGCSSTPHQGNKTPLASVGDEALYQEDLQEAMPIGLHGEDSIRFAEAFVRNWVEDAVLYTQAESNIPDNAKVEELVASYKRALIMHIYQEELIHQKLDNDISEEEIADYYGLHKESFLAKKPYLKGLFMKVPLNAPSLSKVRLWYKRGKQDDIDKLEKYRLANAVQFEYFYDNWKLVSDVLAKMPSIPGGDYLQRNRNIELKDTAYCYFLHVEDFLPQGEQMPLEFAKTEIKELLVNQKRVEYIRRMKDDLYQTALKKGEITYYKNE